MVNYCPQCYETGSKCPKADDSSRTCQYIIADPAALRLASGGYDSQLVQASSALSGVAPLHVDALLSYTPTEAALDVLDGSEPLKLSNL